MVNHILKEEYLGTHKESKVYYNIYMYILQTLIRIIKKEFPTIVLIKTLFKKMSTQIIKNNKEFIIINQLKNSSHFVTQKYTNEYKKRVKIPYYYKDSKGTFKKDNNTIYFLTHKNE